jgi:hypothetical protein
MRNMNEAEKLNKGLGDVYNKQIVDGVKHKFPRQYFMGESVDDWSDVFFDGVIYDTHAESLDMLAGDILVTVYGTKMQRGFCTTDTSKQYGSFILQAPYIAK